MNSSIKWGTLGYGKALSTRNPCLRLRFYLDGDRDKDDDGFEGGDGDEKAFSDPTPPSCHHYVLLHS